MSSMLVNLALLPTKAVVNTYTALTLPFYTIYQRPWQKLRMSKGFGVKTYQDRHGRTVYYRPPPKNLCHPYYQYSTYNEVVKTLDRNRVAIGVRDVLSEQLQVDQHGKPVVIEGKELTKVKLTDRYRWLTAGEVLDRVDAMARGMQQLGIKKGEKVVIYADSSLEWYYTALALTRLSAVVVTLFSTLGDSGVLYGLNQSDARFLVTSDSLLAKLQKLSDKTEFLETVIYIKSHKNSYQNNPTRTEQAKKQLAQRYNLQSMDQVYESGVQIKPYEFEQPKPEDWALIMYTSGTTGNPKGVIISQHQLQQSLMNMLKMDEEYNYIFFNATYAAYLPMAHLFGYIINIGKFLTGSKVAFCSPNTLLNSSPAHVPGQSGDLTLIRPEMLPTVPLVLERIIKEVYRKLNARSPIAAPIFTYLMDYKIRWTARGFDTPIINRLVCRKINQEFGGQLKTLAVSSAPLHERTQSLAKAAFNAVVLNGYGATEVTGASHAMHLSDLNVGRVGVPYSSVKFYLRDWTDGGYTTEDKPHPRGEVVVGGDTVALGYYKMPDETKEAFYTDEDGVRWFYTGDIGEVLPDGSLKIIDRKKDLTKLANGEFVSLGKIESGLRASPYVENICVCTDPYSNDVTALLCPNKKSFEELARKLNKPKLTFEEMCDDPVVNREVTTSIQAMCKQLGFKKREIPVMIKLVKEEWSQDNNLLTAAFKMKRKQVNDFYKKDIQEMYAKINQSSV